MTSALARRLDRLEALRLSRKPRASLVLFGTVDDVERQYQAALVEGRIKPGDPVMKITMSAPASDEHGRVAP